MIKLVLVGEDLSAKKRKIRKYVVVLVTIAHPSVVVHDQRHIYAKSASTLHFNFCDSPISSFLFS